MALGRTDRRIDPAALRAEFPITRRWTYLNHAAFSPPPLRAKRALAEYLDSIEEMGFEDFVSWYDRADHARGLAARLLHTQAGRIAFAACTSDGVNFVANGLDWRPGDNVVTIAGEFPSNVYAWMNLSPRGVELRFVPTDGAGRFGADDVARHVDDHTRVVSLSAVSFSTGFRAPLDAVGALCRDRGALFVVDGIQAVGALDLDVEAAGIDVLAAHAYKWLMGPTGIALVYMSERALEHLRPNALGWRSIADWKNVHDMLHYDLTLPDEARRFEPGMLNFPGLVMLERSLDLILSLGIDAIEERILELTELLAAGLGRKGYEVVSSQKPEERSGIVAFSARGGASAAAVAALQARGIVVAGREGRIRASTHAYNLPEEIDALVEALP